MALAVSWTCQTTTAAISIGLPSASLTLACAVSWLRIRVDTLMRRGNGFPPFQPPARTPPRDLPNNRGAPPRPGAAGGEAVSDNPAEDDTRDAPPRQAGAV